MAEKYLAYPEYKNTDSEWVSEIPVHWEPILFKRVIIQIKDGTHGTHARVSEGFPFLSAKNVLHKGVEISDSESMVSEKDYKEITANGFPKKGDLLITCVGTIGRTCVYEFDKPYAFQRSVAFLRLSDLAEPKFYKYFVESKNYQSQLEANSKASAQSGVYMGDLVSTSTVLLPKDEQKSIANFLDYQTAQIDTLIEKQQTLIQLLKEKRQAVISHAVTKGLNPNAPMKDSGVEWLGEVPEHWEVMKGAFIGQLFGSESVPENQVVKEGILPFIKVSTLSRDGFELQEPEWFVSARVAKNYKTRTSYVVFPKRGAAIFTNKVNVVNEPSLIDPNLMGWQINEKALSKYIALLLKTRKLDDIADVSTVPQINNKHINPEKFPLPPIKEQQEILDYIDGRLITFDDLIDKAEQAIQLMQERRTALVSAAVTGKIDVRGWRAHE